jgi:hypothetical protein
MTKLIPRIHPRSPQTDYEAFLLLYDAPPFGDEFLGAAKIVFGIHLSNNAKRRNRRRTHLVRHPRANSGPGDAWGHWGL